MSNNDPRENKVEQPESSVGENPREDGQLSDGEVDRVSGGWAPSPVNFNVKLPQNLPGASDIP